MKLLQNALRIEENGKVSYLNSVHRHDFVSYTFQNGHELFLDGGLDYRRVGGYYLEDVRITNWSLTTKDNFNKRANKLLWGHYENPDGTGKFKYSCIKDLGQMHLINIRNYLTENGQENSLHYKVVCYWTIEKAKKLVSDAKKAIEALRQIKYN